MPGQAKWIILGSGGGTATPDRASPGHLLVTPRAVVLFDCGDGVTGSFLRAGMTPEDVDVICISHMHPDHNCGLGYFLQQMYLASRKRKLDIYLPGEAIEGIKSYLALNYLFWDRFPFEVNFEPLQDGGVVTCGDVSITPRSNTHLTKHRGRPWMAGFDNRGECFSFEVRLGDRRIAYSADVGAIEDLRFSEGCEMLLVETTHVQLPELFERAETWNLSTLVLIHIGPEFDPTLLDTAGKYFSGEVLIAEDGMAIPLNG